MKERQVVYPWREDCSEQSTSVLLLESRAIALDHKQRQRSNWSYVGGHRSESVKEQDST
jgi:hypothetical protein